MSTLQDNINNRIPSIFRFVCDDRVSYKTLVFYGNLFSNKLGQKPCNLVPFLKTTAPCSLKVTYISRELFTIGLSSM